MRILLQGGSQHETSAIAAALRRGGLAIVDPADEAFDLIVTVGGARSLIRVGPIEVDLAMGETRLRGRRLRLTKTERSLIETLARAGGPLTRAELLETVWGLRFDPGTNIVAVHVHRLRAKIGCGRIVCGSEGYCLTDGEG